MRAEEGIGSHRGSGPSSHLSIDLGDETLATGPPSPGPTALVLLAVAFIGLISDGLTFLSGGPSAGAVLAGLTPFGVSVPVLHRLIR